MTMAITTMSSSSLLRTYHLEHIPANYTVNVALFKDVKNADFLREQLLSGNTEFEYAFIDAAMITTPLHALTAAFHALHSLISSPTHTLRTRNLHSETVFSLSPSNNITESFRRFGISPTTTSLLIVKIVSILSVNTNTNLNALTSLVSGTDTNTDTGTTDIGTGVGIGIDTTTTTPESIAQHLQGQVRGTQVDFCQEEIEKLTDMARVRKYYKLPVGLETKGIKEVEMAVLGAMALRGL